MRTWILLRGLTRECAHWGRFVADFQQALPGDQVLALDLPGNGIFNREVSPATVPQMVQACRAHLAARGLQPPFHVLAMSLGAMVTTDWAYSHPAEIAACVLINTSLRPFSPFYQRLRPVNYGTVLRCVLPWSTPLHIEQLVLKMTSNRVPVPESERVVSQDVVDLVADWVAVRRQRPVSASNALRQLMAAMRYRAPQGVPESSVLLLASRHDRLVSRRCSEAIATAWSVPLRIHPCAGHDLPLDDAPWVVEQVLAWLADAAR